MTDQKKIRIVVMGCGGSGGVPYAGNIWGKCDPSNPRNHRTRPSIYIQSETTKIVVDTGPDFRQQINATGHKGKLDAVLYTHVHSDHVMGIDDLRALFVEDNRTPIPIYSSPEFLAELEKRFYFIFKTFHAMYPVTIIPHALPETLQIGDISIQSFDQIHGDGNTIGFRINDFGYSTDVSDLSDATLEKLKGIKTWIVGAHYSDDGHSNHAGLNKIKKWIDIIKPEITYLTHLTANADYKDMCDNLPDYIRPAYDGLEFFI